MKHLKDCNHCPGPRLSLILEGTGELRHCTLVVILSSSNPQRCGFRDSSAQVLQVLPLLQKAAELLDMWFYPFELAEAIEDLGWTVRAAVRHVAWRQKRYV